MTLLATILCALIALEHAWFAALEIFFWQKPRGLKAFGMKPAQAKATATLAKNQGVYNLFLSAGLVWGTASGRTDLAWFFLGCVVVAGVFGAWTVSSRIFWVQAAPALAAMAALIIGN